MAVFSLDQKGLNLFLGPGGGWLTSHIENGQTVEEIRFGHTLSAKKKEWKIGCCDVFSYC